LYSIGCLAGRVVALFVIAEPIKRLEKYTFADALDSQFNSRGIKLAAARSTLVVSVFYLIPQMVGAGALVTPLLGFSHVIGVVMVGTVVTLIVVTAGMVSTTWAQFIKGALLVIFCSMLTIAILARGIGVNATNRAPDAVAQATAGAAPVFRSTTQPMAGLVYSIDSNEPHTGSVGPIAFLQRIGGTEIVQWTKSLKPGDDWTGKDVKGDSLLLPGGSPTFKGVRSDKFTDKLDLISLMLALFEGTASLPHILIRYYTVKDVASARKSTVVGIAAIGFFYVLTLYLGLGAIVSGNLDSTNTNMAAPLLAKTFGELPIALISAIAFTTVLGTVSGLIMAASDTVANDLLTNFMKVDLDDHGKVLAGKIAAVVVGIIAMVLGVVFQHLNVGFLVGWAFNVVASANLPAIVMLLF